MHVTEAVDVKTLNYLANRLLTLGGKMKLQMHTPFIRRLFSLILIGQSVGC